MTEYQIRTFRSIDDAGPQYELWLRATDRLPHAWRSCVRNVRHQLAQSQSYPASRLYAERRNGGLVGYIGTHPPFEWIAEDHGPPARSLGWAIPFGIPWTWPLSPALEEDLYARMAGSIPDVYRDSRRDLYIQRFRESWTHHAGFLARRGWRLYDRLPLLGRAIGRVVSAPAELAPVAPDDYGLVSEVSERDPTAAAVNVEMLAARCEGGWIDPGAFWRLGERGAFALEPRGRSCAVTAFFAGPDDWDDTLGAAAGRAAAMGASEIYFTVDGGEGRLRQALDARGFREVDAGVYYIRDAD